jgi:hypothetical protein
MEELPMFVHTARLQFESKPDKSDPVVGAVAYLLNAVNASQLGG